MDRAIGRSHEREAVPSRLWLAGGAGGLIAGIAMGMFMMIDSAATGMGFWSPLEVCMASFVYRSEAAMIEKEMMMHPGAPMMMGPLNVGHLAVGALLHMGFSIVVGLAFALILFALARAGVALVRSLPGFVAASVVGAGALYFVMMYLVLPWANPLMCHATSRTPFFISHLVFGAIFGLLAWPLGEREAVRTET
jgi:hypothetical protein